MAYVEPTSDKFTARYPEFADVDSDLIDIVLADAISDVGETWLERDRARAQMLLTAHWLVMEGEPQRSATLLAGGVATPNQGPMKRRKVGDVEVEFQNASERFGSAANQIMGDAGYENTQYGREFKVLMRKNFPAVAVV